MPPSVVSFVFIVHGILIATEAQSRSLRKAVGKANKEARRKLTKRVAPTAQNRKSCRHVPSISRTRKIGMCNGNRESVVDGTGGDPIGDVTDTRVYRKRQSIPNKQLSRRRGGSRLPSSRRDLSPFRSQWKYLGNAVARSRDYAEDECKRFRAASGVQEEPRRCSSLAISADIRQRCGRELLDILEEEQTAEKRREESLAAAKTTAKVAAARVQEAIASTEQESQLYEQQMGQMHRRK